MGNRADRSMGTYSKGMLQRVALAQALLTLAPPDAPYRQADGGHRAAAARPTSDASKTLRRALNLEVNTQ